MNTHAGPSSAIFQPSLGRRTFHLKSNFFIFSLRHSEQLVLIFAQIEVTRINIKTMHSKRKPPPPIRQGPIRPRLSEQEHMTEVWLSHERQTEGFELWAGFGQMSQSNQKVAQLWCCDRSSLMTQPAVLPVSTYFPQCCPVLRQRCGFALSFPLKLNPI